MFMSQRVEVFVKEGKKNIHSRDPVVTLHCEKCVDQTGNRCLHRWSAGGGNVSSWYTDDGSFRKAFEPNAIRQMGRKTKWRPQASPIPSCKVGEWSWRLFTTEIVITFSPTGVRRISSAQSPKGTPKIHPHRGVRLACAYAKIIFIFNDRSLPHEMEWIVTGLEIVCRAVVIKARYLCCTFV